MHKYTKDVHLNKYYVEAVVLRDGRMATSKRWIPFMETPANYNRILKRANKWADGTIKVLQEQETCDA